MNGQKVKQLLKKEEGFKLDFKQKLLIEQESDKKEFAKDVIAIANTPGGRGYILFGIEDRTKKIVGLESIPEHVEERLQQIVGHRSRPPVPIAWETVSIGSKIVGVLTIYKSMQIPHQMLGIGAFYVRRGSTTDVATRHEIATMLQNCGLVSFELVPCYRAKLEDLDFKVISNYLGPFSSITQCLPMLYALGIIWVDETQKLAYPTYGGLLIFGKKPQDYLAHTTLELQVLEERKLFDGSIPVLLEQFRSYIAQLLPETYPLDALLEVVTNALIHRDYWNESCHTVVQISGEAIVVTNPINQLFAQEEQPQPRTNSWLYTRLLLLRQNREHVRLGIGLEAMQKAFSSYGQVTITNSIQDRLCKVVLPLGNAVTKGKD
ncbi:MAG: AlbA family DNA-binding domain-containing protein [Cellulosilyticaceae bacterium]